MSEQAVKNGVEMKEFMKNVVKCGKCGSEAFTEILTFMKVSAVASQTGKAGIAPVGNSYICMNCGTPIEESDAVKELMGEQKSGLIL